ncbi:MAG: flippase-like domain-containing protein [Flavobacteriales bacterium]|nr:flippase-like domain-containing protein [Flavobacteriales bacterium]
MFKKYLRIFLAIAAILFLVFYLYQNLNDFRQIDQVRPTTFCVVIALTTVFLCLNALYNFIILNLLKFNIGFIESFHLSNLSSLLNFILPLKGGLGYKAVYLKKKYEVGYKTFLGVLAISYLLNLIVISVLSIISAVYLSNKYLLIIYSLIFVGLIGLLVFLKFGVEVNIKNDKISGIQSKLRSGWKVLKNSKAVAIQVLSIFVVNHIILCLILIILVKDMFGLNVLFTESVLMTSANTVSFLFNITPASLGIKELFMAGSSDLMGIKSNYIVLFSIIERVLQFIVISFLGIIGYFGLRSYR